jgi:hypothetical protein
VAPQIKLQLAWVAKYLCEVKVIWQLSRLKSGYGGELSFVTVCKVTIMTTNVIKKIINLCRLGKIFNLSNLGKNK